MKHYTVKSYVGDNTDYNSSLCVVDDENNYIVTPGFIWDEDDENREYTGYYAWEDGMDESTCFDTEEELEKFIEDWAEKKNAEERVKLNCLRRNARKRLKKDLVEYVKRNAEMMGWPMKFFRNACLLAVSHYEVSIDEVMNRELMFQV